jgi:histidinol-phosphate aminotransferase
MITDTVTSGFFKEHVLAGKPYKGGSTRDEKESDKKIYKLSSNENPIGPSPKAIAAMQQQLSMLHEYAFQDDSKIKTALEKYFHETISREQFIVANSGLEIIEMVVRGFLDPGLECIISSPAFLAYKNFAELQGATVIDIPLDSENFSLDVNGILSAVNENTRLIFLCSPNNPTATVIPKKKLEKILDTLPDHVVVVYDEVYGHFTRHKEFVRAVDYVKQNKNVIGLNSFSKAFGLAGLRIGYAYTTVEIAEYLNKLRRPFMINSLSTVGAIAALKDIDHILLTQKLVRTERQWLYDQLDELSIFYWPSEANFILFRSPYDNTQFAKDMLEEGIMVRTTDVFGLPGCIRLSIGKREANKACVDAMKKLTENI